MGINPLCSFGTQLIVNPVPSSTQPTRRHVFPVNVALTRTASGRPSVRNVAPTSRRLAKALIRKIGVSVSEAFNFATMCVCKTLLGSLSKIWKISAHIH